MQWTTGSFLPSYTHIGIIASAWMSILYAMRLCLPRIYTHSKHSTPYHRSILPQLRMHTGQPFQKNNTLRHLQVSNFCFLPVHENWGLLTLPPAFTCTCVLPASS